MQKSQNKSKKEIVDEETNEEVLFIDGALISIDKQLKNLRQGIKNLMKQKQIFLNIRSKVE